MKCTLVTFVLAVTMLWPVDRLSAVPPLVSGDVPTAEKESFEWYVGMSYQSEAGEIERQFFFTELVYGISDRQEVTFEIPYLSLGGEHGFGDIVLGTKYMVLKETERLPGISPTFEIKLPSASASRGLGTGEFNYDLRIPVQKTWDWFTLIGNAGYTIIGEPHVNGVVEPRKNVWFVSMAQACEVSEKTKLLSEIYLETADEPGKPNHFAADVGFEYAVSEKFKVHGTVGRSLREGPADLRAYFGFEWEFDAPWKHETAEKK